MLRRIHLHTTVRPRRLRGMNTNVRVSTSPLTYGTTLATGKSRVRTTRKLLTTKINRRRFRNKRTTRLRHFRGNRTMVNMTTQIRSSTVNPTYHQLSLVSRIALIIKLRGIRLGVRLKATHLSVVRRYVGVSLPLRTQLHRLNRIRIKAIGSWGFRPTPPLPPSQRPRK